MKIRKSIEETAIEVCKRHSHAQITELHVLRALHSKIGSQGSEVSTKEVDKELDKIPVTRNAILSMSPGAEKFLNLIDVEDPFEIRDAITDSYFKPVSPTGNDNEGPNNPSKNLDEFASFEPDQVRQNPKPKNPNKVKTESLETVLAELNSLIGLGKAKKQVDAFIAVHAMNVMRKKQNLLPVNIGLHLVFTGSPGTGKTTVARLIGRLYKAIGLLEKGDLVEVDRSDLIAGYVGQTALRTQAKIVEAEGGVLFIDEAYSLAADSGSEYGFGDEAISTLVKAMEDKRDKFAVIVAGYSEDMDTFIKSNKGLKSRFQTFIEFEDYSVDELVQIFRLIATQSQVDCPDQVQEAIRQYIELRKPVGEDGNGRFARNLFEQMFQNMTTRAMKSGSISRDEFNKFSVDDVPVFDPSRTDNSTNKRPFGFI